MRKAASHVRRTDTMVVLGFGVERVAILVVGKELAFDDAFARQCHKGMVSWQSRNTTRFGTDVQVPRPVPFTAFCQAMSGSSSAQCFTAIPGRIPTSRAASRGLSASIRTRVEIIQKMDLKSMLSPPATQLQGSESWASSVSGIPHSP